jgi:type II secretory pathway pseudopilin PulG
MVKCRPPRGFTYFGLLLLVALLSSTLALAGVIWHAEMQREREHELLFAGDQILRAIQRFREKTPAGQRARFPESLDELIDDRRWPTTRRHLRRIYVEPMTGSKDWAVVKAPDGGVMGVHSRSKAVPMKRAGFALAYEDFGSARTIADWRFEFAATPPASAGTGARAPGQP